MKHDTCRPLIICRLGDKDDRIPRVAAPKKCGVRGLCGKHPTVRRKANGEYWPSVSFERAEELASRCLPNLHGAVITPAGQCAVVPRIKGHAIRGAPVPFERAEEFSAGSVP